MSEAAGQLPKKNGLGDKYSTFIRSSGLSFRGLVKGFLDAGLKELVVDHGG